MVPDPSTALRTGIRAARVGGVTVPDEPLLIAGRWAFRFLVDLGTAAEGHRGVPQVSEWYAVLDVEYPFGSIAVFPSKTSGVEATFEHQELNLAGEADVPWRTGKICLDSPVRRLSLVAPGGDPVGAREERINWHLARASAWVAAAHARSLSNDGDPFELPHCPTAGQVRVVHDESQETYQAWAEATSSWGQVVWGSVPGVERTVVAASFLKRDGQVVRKSARYDEQLHGHERQERWTGIWWVWPSPIILEPWRQPITWGELRAAGKAQGVHVDERLREIARVVRGKEAVILLLGFAIPVRRGDTPTEIHWRALGLPELKRGGKVPSGFRKNERGYWMRDRNDAFGGKKRLKYQPTSNWHPDRLQARGRYGDAVRQAKIALIGCGALGSLLAELLVRGGVTQLLLIDHDCLAAENLVRHTLSGGELGKNKAAALAAKLATVSPFASVTALESRLPSERQKLEAVLENYEIVLDCTASSEVLMVLAQGWWSLPMLFLSLSVGHRAKRIFIYAHRGNSFPRDDFATRLEPYLALERHDWSAEGETIEGAGCWSPLFPARLDDMTLAAASCGKVIEELVRVETVDRELIVFEHASDASFTGLRRVGNQEVSEQSGGDK